MCAVEFSGKRSQCLHPALLRTCVAIAWKAESDFIHLMIGLGGEFLYYYTQQWISPGLFCSLLLLRGGG